HLPQRQSELAPPLVPSLPALVFPSALPLSGETRKRPHPIYGPGPKASPKTREAIPLCDPPLPDRSVPGTLLPDQPRPDRGLVLTQFQPGPFLPGLCADRQRSGLLGELGKNQEEGPGPGSPCLLRPVDHLAGIPGQHCGPFYRGTVQGGEPLVLDLGPSGLRCKIP